ncbi:hypothetical protein [Streptomyces sp. SS]|uniref:hypothetical protein n=1 Tax=Streptomyces sp. SS TaxID=260742 RepID=UPI00307A989E
MRAAPGWVIGSPMSRPDSTACVDQNEPHATTAPNTACTTATTSSFAAMSVPRAGTAVNVVRISPLPYSPTTETAPMAAEARIRTSAALYVNASHSAMSFATNSARLAASYWRK